MVADYARFKRNTRYIHIAQDDTATQVGSWHDEKAPVLPLNTKDLFGHATRLKAQTLDYNKGMNLVISLPGLRTV